MIIAEEMEAEFYTVYSKKKFNTFQILYKT